MQWCGIFRGSSSRSPVTSHCVGWPLQTPGHLLAVEAGSWMCHWSRCLGQGWVAHRERVWGLSWACLSQGTLTPQHSEGRTMGTEASEAGTRVVRKDSKTLSVPPGEAGNLIVQFSVVTNKVMRPGTRNLEVKQILHSHGQQTWEEESEYRHR